MTEQQKRSVSPIYEIKFKGVLPASWADWFAGMSLTHDCKNITTLKGEVVDQAALHGQLKIIRDLGLELLAVNRLENN